MALLRCNTAWKPTDVAGCKLWLKADAGITKDGSDYVSAWADQSGNGNDASQGTGTNQPLWVDTQLNGKPVIRFDGINDYLKSVLNASITQPMTVFIIYTEQVGTLQMQLSSNYVSSVRLYLATFTTGVYLLINPSGIDYIRTAPPYTILNTLICNGASSYIYENGVQKKLVQLVRLLFQKLI